jgi:hypothetical protein
LPQFCCESLLKYAAVTANFSQFCLLSINLVSPYSTPCGELAKWNTKLLNHLECADVDTSLLYSPKIVA